MPNVFSPLPVDLAKGPRDPIPTDPLPWEIGEVLQEAWEKFKANAAILIACNIIIFVVVFMLNLIIAIPLGIIGGIIAAMLSDQGQRELGEAINISISMGTNVLSALPNMILQLGFLQVCLAVARNEEATIGLMIKGLDRLLSYLGYTFLAGLLFLVGFLLLIVPGVILALGLSMGALFLIDTNLGIVDAMKASWRATDGHKLQLWLMGLLLGIGMMLAGCATCGLGWLVFVPIMQLCYTIVFTRISGRLRSGLPDPVLDTPAS
jgi:uncharacterized membrane protein